MSQKSKPHILRDTREQAGWLFEPNECFAGTKSQKLDTGDYTIEGFESQFVIERKASASEFASNVTQDRFIAELDRLTAFRRAFIICEFSLRDLRVFPLGSTVPKSKQGSIRVQGKFLLSRALHFVVKYGVNILFADSHQLGQEVAMSLCKRIVDECVATNG